MMARNASTLIEYGYYRFSQATLQSGRKSPYSARYPKPTSKHFLVRLGQAAAGLRVFSRVNRIHIVGITQSGIGLTKAIANTLEDRHKAVFVTILNPRRRSVDNMWFGQDVELHILVDNAVTTGDTLQKAQEILRDNGYVATSALYTFDREEVEENGLSIAQIVKSKTGLTLVPIFRIRDLLPFLPRKEVSAICRYLMRYGTRSIQKHLEDRYVF